MGTPRLQGSRSVYSRTQGHRSGENANAASEAEAKALEREYALQERRHYQASEFEEEQDQLIQRIIRSTPFKTSRDGRRLLVFLWEHRQHEIDAGRLEYHFYNKLLKRGFDPDSGRGKTQATQIRKRLVDYFEQNPREKWQCFLPKKNETEELTYLLEFFPAPVVLQSPGFRFWEPHLSRAALTQVVTGVHYFFYNAEKKLVIRLPFFEVERGSTNKAILANIGKARSDIDFAGFEPWQNTYLAVGDIEGYEVLSNFFRECVQTNIPRITAAHTSLQGVRQKAPIVFGRPQTNPLIKELFTDACRKPGKASELGFRMHDEQGTITISGLRKNERMHLKDFPVSADGVIGPVTGMRKVFCIVTRFLYPGTDDPVTIFACDYYSPIIARVIKLLIDSKKALKLFEKLEWSNLVTLPDTFELLFAVDRLDGDVPDESSPELITWRIP